MKIQDRENKSKNEVDEGHLGSDAADNDDATRTHSADAQKVEDKLRDYTKRKRTTRKKAEKRERKRFFFLQKAKLRISIEREVRCAKGVKARCAKHLLRRHAAVSHATPQCFFL